VVALACAALAVTVWVAPAAAQAEEELSPFMNDYLADFERVSGKLVSLAEAVPADKYSWQPSGEVRTVSEVYMHVTGANFGIPAGLGATPAKGMEGDDLFAILQQLEAEVTAKEAVIAKLEGSIAYAKEAVKEVAAAGLEEQSELFGFPASQRAYLMILLTHSHEHLGQSIAYARSIGVVPPWSRPQAEEGEGGGGR
jgi:uncharacterized damage-inducible protein DinB